MTATERAVAVTERAAGVAPGVAEAMEAMEEKVTVVTAATGVGDEAKAAMAGAGMHTLNLWNKEVEWWARVGT